MKRVNLLILVLSLTASGFAQSQPADKPLFDVDVGDRTGYIDATGQIVIPAQFETAEPFSEGLALVLIGGRLGFIDTSGAVIIPPRFARGGRFSQGLASVGVRDGSVKYGFIDRTGRIVIAAQFDEADDFNEGLAAVRVGEFIRYIDSSGRVMIDLHERRFENEVNLSMYPRRFSQGLAGFTAPSGALGCLNRAGQFDPELKIAANASSSPEGLSLSAKCKEKGGRWVTEFKWGFMDRSGKPVISPRFDQVDRFHEGLARAVIGGQPGYVDTTGTMVLPLPGAKAMGSFSQGLAAVRVADKWGYIDTKGTMAIAPQFDDARAFVADRACVKIGDNEGYIDRTGRLAIPLKFEGGADFVNGLAKVNPRIGCSEYIDRDGHVVWRSSGVEKGLPCAEPVTLQPGDPFVDPRDGQSYPTVLVGSTSWLGRNLAFAAPQSWCYDNAATCEADGRLYSWSAARAACPSGWHLSTDDEWRDLELYVGMPAKLFELWDRSTEAGPDLMIGGSSGFAAPPAGIRDPGRAYAYKGDAAEFWTSTETDRGPIQRMLSTGGIKRGPLPKGYAMSARCVRDSNPLTVQAPAPGTSAPAESTLEIARKTAEEGETVESAGHADNLHLEAVDQAAAALDAYRKLHPDDTKALLLAARLGRLQEIGVQTSGALLPEIGRKREAEESQAGHLRELQSLADRVLAIEPDNAAAHYWKARLFGFSNRTVYGPGPEPGIWDVERAILSAKKAVELAPAVVAYREALASYLVTAQKFGEASAALAEVAGGRHPMSVLLREIDQVPVPKGAIALPGAARQFAASEAEKGRLSDYPDLRVRS